MPRQFGGVEGIGSQNCSLGIEASTKDSMVFRSRRGEGGRLIELPVEEWEGIDVLEPGEGS